MIGLIDVGGGTRGIYGAGVMDRFMEEGIRADLVIGVSAGSANAASYLAGQKGRNYRFYNDYAFRKEYMSFRNYFHTGSYIGLDYIYGTLTNKGGEDPLDYQAMTENPADMIIVATDAEYGTPVYFKKEEIREDDYYPMKASCCVPVIDPPYPVGDKAYYDGGLSDPIPYKKALAEGCTELVVILTRPKEYFRSSKRDREMARFIENKYPRIARAMSGRASLYNRQLGELLKLEQEGRACIVAPDDISRMKTLTTDHKALDLLYQKGYNDAANAILYLQKHLA